MITLIAAFVAIVCVAALLGAFRGSGPSIQGSCGGGCVCIGDEDQGSAPTARAEASTGGLEGGSAPGGGALE